MMTGNTANTTASRTAEWIVVVLIVLVPLTVMIGRGIAQSTDSPPAVVTIDGESGEAVFRAFCAACHQLPNAGTEADIPPDLRFEGSRVQYDWLVGYLADPARPLIRWESEEERPALTMPAFRMTRELTEDVARYLMSKRDSILIAPSGIDWDSMSSPEAVAEGRKLFEEYQCLGCHSLGGTGAEIGPSLDGVGSRLQSDFMYRWILEPEKIVPDTAMPNEDLWDDEAKSLVLFLRSLNARE